MNPRREKIPAEPLSRRTWDRIEAGLFERLDHDEHLEPPPAQRRAVRRYAPLWMAISAAAAAGLLWWRASLPEPELARQDAAPVISEQAPPSPPGPASSPDVAAVPAVAGTRIITTTGPTQTTVGDSVVTIAEHSVLRVAGSDVEGWLLTLHEGQVDCLVSPRRQRPPFVVLAGDARISVVGTKFQVTRQGAGALVAVTEGKVRVESGGESVLLGPGDTWPATAKPGRKKGTSWQQAAASERFARATQLEASDPDAALRIYRDLSQRRGPWAANALYARARLELDRGNGSTAERLLTRYLRAYPKGANAADARQLLSKLRGQ